MPADRTRCPAFSLLIANFFLCGLKVKYRFPSVFEPGPGDAM